MHKSGSHKRAQTTSQKSISLKDHIERKYIYIVYIIDIRISKKL